MGPSNSKNKKSIQESLQEIYAVIEPLGKEFNMAAGILILLIIGIVIYALMTSAGNGSLKRLLAAKESTLSALDRTRPNPPSGQRAAFLELEFKKLTDMEIQLESKDFFWKKLAYTEKERLEFKELLFDLRQELDKMAQAGEVLFAEDATLPDFAQSLPSKEELPRLFMALKLSEELRRIIIDSKVAQVDEMTFPEAESSDFSTTLARHVFMSKIKLLTSWESMLNMLDKISKSSYLWKVEQIDIQNQGLETQQKPSEVVESEITKKAPITAEISISGTFYSKPIPGTVEKEKSSEEGTTEQAVAA